MVLKPHQAERISDGMGTTNTNTIMQYTLICFVGDTEYRFEFAAYKDPAELYVQSATMRLPEYADPIGEWHESNLMPADHERMIWENQKDWQPAKATEPINAAQYWAQKVKDTAKEVQIY